MIIYLAQVDVEADYRNALGMGFSILANYIFGGNKKKSKIPMTTPVAGVNVSGSEKIPMTFRLLRSRFLVLRRFL